MLTDINLLTKKKSELELNEQLVQACLDIDLINIKRLLNEGANPNFLTTRHQYEEYDEEGEERTFQTPLDILADHYAYTNDAPTIYLNVADAAKLLLEHGANVNGGKTGLYSNMPLHDAADSANLPLIQVLVKWGANVNTPDCDLGYTPLHLACGGFGGFAPLELVAFLIHHGADMNAQSDDGRTPAHIIMSYDMNTWLGPKYLPLLQALSYHGADFTIVDQEGQSPLSLMQNRPDLKKAIIDGLLTNSADANDLLKQQFIQLLPQFGLSDLKELSMYENKSIAMNILDQIIEAHLISIYPENLLEHQLIQASIDVNLDKVATLLAQGANPNFVSPRKKWDYTGLTAMSFLMENAYRGTKQDTLGIMKLLLESGANPNAAISTGDTPLHDLINKSYYHSTTFFSQAAFDLLIDFGADVNLQNNKGQTPAHLALGYHNNIFMLTNLIKEGADLTIENNEHKTVLDLAENNPAAQRVITTLLGVKENTDNIIHHDNDISDPICADSTPQIHIDLVEHNVIIQPVIDSVSILPAVTAEDTMLSIGDIIIHDTQDALFGDSNQVITVTPEDGKTTPIPYEGYVPLFIMQWLGLEPQISVNNISE